MVTVFRDNKRQVLFGRTLTTRVLPGVKILTVSLSLPTSMPSPHSSSPNTPPFSELGSY